MSAPRSRRVNRFTGTAIWIDPPTRGYLILLTNRAHPSGGGAARIRELRLRVAAAVGGQLFQPPVVPDPGPAGGPAADGPAAETRSPAEAAPRAERVLTGLDVLVGQNFAMLAGQSIGLVTNQTGVDATGRRAIDLLAAAPGVRLRVIFSPEHGITGQANAEVPHSRDAATGRPVWSLYGSAAADAGDAQGRLARDLRHPGRRRAVLQSVCSCC